MLSVVGLPRDVWGDGILEAISGNVETNYSFVSTKTRDASGNTTTLENNNYNNRFTLNVNHNLYPNLNLNAGGTFEKNISDPSNAEESESRTTDFTRIRPFVLLTLRNPVYNASVGYDLREDTLRTSGLPKLTLTQENYNASLNWRPEALPWTTMRFTRTQTQDEPRTSRDTEQDYFYVKSQYYYRGLDVYYAGTYINTQDKILNFESTEFSNEGRVLYATTLFNGRTSVSTDNRLNVATLDTASAGQGQVSFPLFPIAGLSSLDDTPMDGALEPTPALIDGNLATSAGLNIGLPPLGGNTQRRNIGLDFLTAVELNTLLVWVDRELPQDIANSFSWDVYTSTDNLNWAFNTTVSPARFGPFLNRFEINFPAVRTRYIKVVTRPLSASVIIPPTFNDPDKIFVTEIQAFLNRPAQEVKGSFTRTFQNYTLDVKTRILDTPSLYHDFNAYYSEADPVGQRRYSISNGLFFAHRLSPILLSSANASVEYGSEGEDRRIGFLYYASLLANPLRTLVDSLVFSGSHQDVGGKGSTTNSLVLYNNAQLYKGIDANLNLGFVLSSQEQDTGGSSRRTETYLNLGTNITPHPSMVLTGYYTGRKSYVSGSNQGPSRDTMENRLDLGVSYNPFRTLFLSASVSILSETGRKTKVQQSYGLNWAPFPDGNLQFSFFYNENYTPDRSRIIQPTVRWYLGARRRSYLDLSYQRLNAEAGSTETESNIISSTLKIYF